MHPGTRRPPRPGWLQGVLAALLAILFVGIYLALLRYTMDITRSTSVYTTSERDTFYLALHGVILVGAAIAGFALGKWLNGLGLAYAVLLVVVVCVAMIVAQTGSQTLACRDGRNDIIRHWTC